MFVENKARTRAAGTGVGIEHDRRRWRKKGVRRWRSGRKIEHKGAKILRAPRAGLRSNFEPNKEAIQKAASHKDFLNIL